jgi:hypothetical protein
MHNLYFFKKLVLYDQLNRLKKEQPDLKTILRITDDNGILFSKLSRKSDTRSMFVKNTIE